MHLLTLKDWSGEQIADMVDLGISVKGHPEAYASHLKDKTLAMVFQKTSTRTRCAFEVGMTQLGGHGIYLDWRTTNFIMADVRDESKVLSRYADLIMARLLKHADLRAMAEGSEVPVINGCCEKYHPCQALGDLMTVKEVEGRLEGVRLVYVGIHNNVCNSLIAGCTNVGMEITVVAPEMNEPSRDESLLDAARATGLYKTTLDLEGAAKRADIVYTDTWVDMEFFLDPKFEQEKQRRIKTFKPYQLNKALLEGSDARVMHCMPAHRGYEITEDVVEAPRSILFDQAENRMHVQKALMMRLLGKA